MNKQSLLDPKTKISGIGNPKIEDYWAWAFSDLLSNLNRAIFGEYIVAHALEMSKEPRIEWDNVDVRYKEFGIEVKTTGFIQTWSDNINQTSF